MSRSSKHGCHPSPYGKRTKLWWAMLNYDERRELWHLERSKGFSNSNYPDDMQECGYCGQPTIGHDLCKVCWERWELLVTKASLQSEHVKTVMKVG